MNFGISVPKPQLFDQSRGGTPWPSASARRTNAAAIPENSAGLSSCTQCPTPATSTYSRQGIIAFNARLFEHGTTRSSLPCTTSTGRPPCTSTRSAHATDMTLTDRLASATFCANAAAGPDLWGGAERRRLEDERRRLEDNDYESDGGSDIDIDFEAPLPVGRASLR